MRDWSAGWRRLTRLWRPDPVADVEAELRFHFDEKVTDLIARGSTPDAARAQAEREFGDVDSVRRGLREIDDRIAQHRQRAEWWEGIAQDVAHTLRSLRRSPGFTLAVVLCLAIGIGASTTMFGIVDALLLRAPSGVRDPGSLVWIGAELALPGMFTDVGDVSYPDFIDFSRSPALNGAAAYSVEPRSFGRGTDVQEVNTAVVTHSFMLLLGAIPARGRFFSVDEDRPGAAAVVVLGYGFWQRQFGGATDVVGKSVRVGTDTYEVVGVAPRDFNGVERARVDVYLPVGPGNDDLLTNRNNSFLTVIGRLRPGFRMEWLADRLNFVYHHAADNRAADNDFRKYTTIRVASPMATTAMRSPQQIQDANVSLWLAGVAGVVLLIACANVVNLLLTRSVHRRRETAIRLALGVGRGRLVRQLLTESLVLASAGGVAALFVSRWGGAIVRATLLPDAFVGATPLDVRLLAVTILATVATGLVCGLAPALQSTRPNLTTALKAGARARTRGGGRVRSSLLVGQVALTLVLLIGAGLFVRSLNSVRAIDLGYDAERVLNVGVNYSSLGYTPQQAPQLYQRLLERVRTLPGVQQASLATSGPFGIMTAWRVSVPGHALEPGMNPFLHAVTPDFFGTLGIALRSGRLLTNADRAGSERVAVVNEEMARHYWPAGDALGKCIRIGGDTKPCTTVVGVVATLRLGNIPGKSVATERPAKAYFVPLDQRSDMLERTLYVRTTGAAAAAVPAVRHAIQEMAPDLPYPRVMALSTELAPHTRPWRLGAMMFSIFGGVALVLAVIGLYGVLAYTVSQRRSEIGVRIALGAQRGDVVRLVVGQGLRVTGLGVAIGAAVALAGGRALAALLFGVSANDPLVFAAMGGTLVAVAAIASYLPARRATTIDPAQALRAD